MPSETATNYSAPRPFPKARPRPDISGTLNGKPFTSFRDADPDIGARLEVYAAGAYLWIPFRHIASIAMEPPKHLRDTLWADAMVMTGPSFKGTDLGQVIIPAIYPFSWKDPDESVWLGRTTVWNADDQGKEYPSGQKVFLVDGEEFPLLEVRELEFQAEPRPPAAAGRPAKPMILLEDVPKLVDELLQPIRRRQSVRRGPPLRSGLRRHQGSAPRRRRSEPGSLADRT